MSYQRIVRRDPNVTPEEKGRRRKLQDELAAKAYAFREKVRKFDAEQAAAAEAKTATKH